jgi:two-component system, LuxR family, response regulator FixJ
VVRGLTEALSIYVVDDDDAVRDSLAVLLEPEGFTVRQFSSVDSFLEVLEEDPPGDGGRACLLLDLHMPGKGGQELLDILGRRESRLPVVVMTGNTDEKTRAQALLKGAVAFLEKPVDADRLIDTLRDALG